MTLGKIVEEYLREHKMSQRSFAKKCGMSNSYISMIVNEINPRSNSPIVPTLKTLNGIAAGMNITLDRLLFRMDNTAVELNFGRSDNAVKIPVLGNVRAGIPMAAIQNILDYEEISEETASQGEFFGLQIKGSSMEPKFSEGDVVIVRKQEDVDSGDIAIVLINGEDATIKKIHKYGGGITLIPSNPAYDVCTFTNEQILSLPVKILGKVVELRAKF